MENKNPILMTADIMSKLDSIEVRGVNNLALMIEAMQELQELRNMMAENAQKNFTVEVNQNGR